MFRKVLAVFLPVAVLLLAASFVVVAYSSVVSAKSSEPKIAKTEELQEEILQLKDEIIRLQGEANFALNLVDVGHTRFIEAYLRMSEMALNRSVNPTGNTPYERFYAFKKAESEGDWATLYDLLAKKDREGCSKDAFLKKLEGIEGGGWTYLDITAIGDAVLSNGKYAVVYYTKGYKSQDELVLLQLEEDGWHMIPFGINCAGMGE